MKDYIVNRITGFFLLLLSILLVILVPRQVPEATYKQIEIAAEQADFFPYLAAILLGIMSLILIAGSFFPHAEDKEKSTLGKITINREMIAVLVLIFLFIVTVEFVGFLLNAILLIFILMYIMGQRHWVKMAVISVGMSLVINYFFVQAARVPMPPGLLQGIF